MLQKIVTKLIPQKKKDFEFDFGGGAGENKEFSHEITKLILLLLHLPKFQGQFLQFSFWGVSALRHTKRRSQEIGQNYLEVFLDDDRLRLWASVKVRECYNEVELEDEGRVSIVQDILRQSPDFLRRITPSDGGGVTLSHVCVLFVIASRLKDYIWSVSSWHGKKQLQLVVCCVRWPSTTRGPRTESLGHTRHTTDHRNAKVFRARAAPHGFCDKLINAVKLLKNQLKVGDSPVGMFAGGRSAQNNVRAQVVDCS